MRKLAICTILATASAYGDFLDHGIAGSMGDYDHLAPGSEDSHGNQCGPVAPWDGNGDLGYKLVVDFGHTAPGSQDRNGHQVGPVAPWDSNGVTSGGWDGFDDCCAINDHYAMPEPETL